MDKKHKSVSTILGQEKKKWTAVSLAWSTGVLNGKQLNATAHKRKKAAILQPDMQQAIYVSQKVRNVFPSEHAVAEASKMMASVDKSIISRVLWYSQLRWLNNYYFMYAIWATGNNSSDPDLG